MLRELGAGAELDWRGLCDPRFCVTSRSKVTANPSNSTPAPVHINWSSLPNHNTFSSWVSLFGTRDDRRNLRDVQASC